MKLYKKLLGRIENGNTDYCNIVLAKDLEGIANTHFKEYYDEERIKQIEMVLYKLLEGNLCCHLGGELIKEVLDGF